MSRLKIQGGQGFLARNRNNFARHGLMVALVDVPSDAGSRGITPKFRMSSQHAQDIEKIISRLRQEANIPVWLIGISLGNYSSVNAAVYAKDTIAGLVIASAATRSEPNSLSASVTPNGILGMEFDAIVVPTLIVFHQDDACYGTPASGAPKIQASLTNAPEVSVQHFTGGKTLASQTGKQSFSSGKRKPRSSGGRQSGSPGRKGTDSAGKRQAPPQECGTRDPIHSMGLMTKLSQSLPILSNPIRAMSQVYGRHLLIERRRYWHGWEFLNFQVFFTIA